MSLTVAPGIKALADYWPGEADMPALLLVHGFLQTREFPTVRRLAAALAEEGYGVLAPTLSLGINARQQSLACEAIHTHDMAQDVDELRAWSVWLAQRSGRPPVLIGHSTGAIQVAALLERHPELPLAAAVLVSPSCFDEELGPSGARLLHARATHDLAQDADLPARYSLSYCKTYTSLPAQLLSYLQWNAARVSEALLDVQVPLTVIYGDRDEHIDRAWVHRLGDAGARLQLVPGANHFFDLAHEFDLLDGVISVVSTVEHDG